MKPFCIILGLVVGCLASAQIASAGMIGGYNWADAVVDYTANIQNFHEEEMTGLTEWWVVGPSDADQNDDGEAFAFPPYGPDQDSVAGWKKFGLDEWIVVQFYTGLADVEGNDLVIRMYCGPNARASVSASTNGGLYTQIGSIEGQSGQVPGKPGFLYDAEFDFDDAFGALPAHYVKVKRLADGPNTGMFFDSFASTLVPEPTTLALLGVAGLLVAACWVVTRRRAQR